MDRVVQSAVLFLVVLACGVGARPSQGYEEYIYEHLPELLDRLQRLDYADKPSINTLEPRVAPHWPASDVSIGQVGGIAVDPTTGDILVFHRGEREWGYNSFVGDKFAPGQHTIKNNTILRLDRATGHILDSFGADRFYMPHGLTVDHAGNLWVTDVGLHQVMMFPKGSHEPSDIVLGEAGIPGSDDDHFCKPTDVAVASNGDFFVSDGYCNGRIMKFSKKGHLLKQWGKKSSDGNTGSLSEDEFFVPHSLALIEARNIICVADREHGRIQCFTAGLNNGTEAGYFVHSFDNPEFGKVFAIAYDNNGPEEAMYLVSGPMPNAFLFKINLNGEILFRTEPPNQFAKEDKTGGFGQPHDLAVSQDGREIYTGEIVPNRALKFCYGRCTQR
ncbi:probable peptidyl-alpha-hydroxyglycine alpha-amidating lyase pgal-1 [Mizuhopecten yessoensis]|uniref:peptidylamidoglycolate lyase n=1 Tax=Mizuhopecten yessoensis TaxID=6573 RepID=A0A210QGL7_MIZYE|nr:probable peptidyl-alpha-hydroxyglycine alpha-amidating lyase pgal-1 [Mizuhopecten yessoensis]OWF47913.1 Peptidyl-alpha-hydroxyglycine alpha-amidating lyase 1 [Mizuhopecten yessoensis]